MKTMNKKLWYLTRLSLNKKIKSKWFVVANIIILIVLIGILNIDYIIKLFGGDFDKFTNILVVDNTNYVYDDLENIYNESSKYIEDIKNSTITLSDKTTEELKENLKDKDIILEINNDNDNFINAKVIVNGSVDTIIYQFITTSINQVKTNVALNSYGIDKDTMDLIEKSVDIEKININEDKKDDDLTNLALGVIFPIVILPVFLLVTYLVQMIGSEINEEKSTKSMEIIISNVSPEVHFLSKLISSNTFVLFQGLLMIIYSLFGGLLRLILSGGNVLSSNNEVLSDVYIIHGADVKQTTSGEKLSNGFKIKTPQNPLHHWRVAVEIPIRVKLNTNYTFSLNKSAIKNAYEGMTPMWGVGYMWVKGAKDRTLMEINILDNRRNVFSFNSGNNDIIYIILCIIVL